MKFIPEEWEPIYYRGQHCMRRSTSVTIGEIIDARLDADVKIGLAQKDDVYSVELKDELSDVTEEEIRSTPAYLYENLPPFVVTTSYETVSYVLNGIDQSVWLWFTNSCIKESETIWGELKEYVTECKLGNPADIVSTLTEEEKAKEQDEDTGWTAWVGDWVIFPVMYDGYFSISSAPRNPCNHKTGPVGGG